MCTLLTKSCEATIKSNTSSLPSLSSSLSFSLSLYLSQTHTRTDDFPVA